MCAHGIDAWEKGKAKVIDCVGSGRYLVVQIVLQTAVLNLCEVEVYRLGAV